MSCLWPSLAFRLIQNAPTSLLISLPQNSDSMTLGKKEFLKTLQEKEEILDASIFLLFLQCFQKPSSSKTEEFFSQNGRHPDKQSPPSIYSELFHWSSFLCLIIRAMQFSVCKMLGILTHPKFCCLAYS